MIFFILIVAFIIYYLICYYFLKKKYNKTNKENNAEENNKEIYIRQEEIEHKEDIRKQEIKIQEYTQQQYYPYHKKQLLTKNEYYFYKKLKSITEPLNLQILAKIRLADLIEVDKYINNRQWGFYFNKIKAKHIDFAITDDMKIIALIELDDYTHNRTERKERDIFVNDVLYQTGYILIRTYGDIQQIKNFFESRENYMNINKEIHKVN